LGLLGVAPVRISRRVSRGVGEISGGEVAGVSSRSWVDNRRRGGGAELEGGSRRKARRSSSAGGTATREREGRRGKEKGDGCTITLTCDQMRLRATLPYIDTEVSSYFNGTR
jgi:hypothetical protein